MHDHAPAPGGIRPASHRRLLMISLCCTSVIMVVQVVGAIVTGSLALLADAAHMFADASALVIALIAAAVAARPADDRRTFGYQRAEVFGALVNGLVLSVLAGWVAVEAIGRLAGRGEVTVAGTPMLVVAVMGLVANGVSMWLLSRAQRTNINVRGAYLEVMGDLIGSAMVIIAAIVIVTTGWMQADAIASLLIAVMIIPRAFSLLSEVLSVLAESAPKGMAVSDIREHLLGYEGVVGVHDVHVWQLTRGAPVFTAHVSVAAETLSSGRSAALLVEMTSCLAEHFDVEHSTFQIEPAEQSGCEPHHA
ncbi:MAG: cation diffusion facilitator family transporter [Microbacterium sp.]